MANVYEGSDGDARQSDGTPAPSLFRKRYRQLSDDEVALHDAIKDKADELAGLFVRVLGDQTMKDGGGTHLLERLATQKGPNVTLALRHLEDAVYRAVKALTA